MILMCVRVNIIYDSFLAFVFPQVPLFIPWVVLIVSLYMVISPIVQNPQVEFLYAALFAVSGLVFYVPCVVYKFQPVLLSKFHNTMWSIYFLVYWIGVFKNVLPSLAVFIIVAGKAY